MSNNLAQLRVKNDKLAFGSDIGERSNEKRLYK
jgi:hypothetical protein